MIMSNFTEEVVSEMQREIDFKNTVDKIFKAINEIETANKEETLHKEKILYVLLKLCETEEILNENILILDKESTNGLTANYQKKFKR